MTSRHHENLRSTYSDILLDKLMSEDAIKDLDKEQRKQIHETLIQWFGKSDIAGKLVKSRITRLVNGLIPEDEDDV